MLFLYTIGIYFYGFFIKIASLFNPKARLFVKGRNNLFENVKKQINPKEPLIWFHAASLGEFEQGKPIMERCKTDFPNHKILVTFFSPSGYELRKNDPVADYVFYLPLDTPSNMKQWLDLVNPDWVILIKYEFWFNLLTQLHKRSIPILVISVVFRPKQLFFKPYGIFMRNILKKIQHFFVQDEQSLHLLKNHEIHQVSLSGDTRFDRVSQLRNEIKPLSFIEKFKNQQFTIVAGSTWKEGETFFTQFINATTLPIKCILVPHEIHPQKIKNLKQNLTKNVILYSEINQQNPPQNLTDYDVLIIDAIGFLTAVYPYADIAYVGGAYGSNGIHNILEPAVFGKPVFYGPHFNKNKEATDLATIKGAKIAYNYTDFESIIHFFYNDIEALKFYGQNAQQFIQKKRGTTKKIIFYLNKQLQNSSSKNFLNSL